MVSGVGTFGTRPEQIKKYLRLAAVIEGITNSIEHPGEYALFHCEILSENRFIVETTGFDKFFKGN